MPVHEHIKEWRKRRGWRQQDLVDKVKVYIQGFAVSHLSKLENGHRVVKADEVPKFAKVLGLRTEELHDPQPE